MEDEIHLACPDDNCYGNVTFEGIKDGEDYYKCCICFGEFSHRDVRRKEMRDKKNVTRRK